jgi:hypothetical protein
MRRVNVIKHIAMLQLVVGSVMTRVLLVQIAMKISTNVQVIHGSVEMGETAQTKRGPTFVTALMDMNSHLTIAL